MSNSNDLIIPCGFTPRPYQRNLLQQLDGIPGHPETKKKRAVLVWHRRGGKDITSWCYMIKEAITTPGLYAYFFPQYHQGRLALWEGIDKSTGKRYLEYLGGSKAGTGVIANLNKQEMSIELINGSIIRIVGTDNFHSIRGSNPIGCVFSEYAWHDPSAWHTIRPILRVNGGWAIFNSTPDGPNHLLSLVTMAKNNPNWVCSVLDVTKTVGEDGERIVSDEMIEEERKEGMPEDMIQQEYFCNFKTQMQGSVYGDLIIKAREDGRVGDYPVNDAQWVDTFWDLGGDDYTAIWFRQIQDGKIVWVDYYQERCKPIHHYVEILQERGYKYRSHFLPHDAAMRPMPLRIATADILAESLREAGLAFDVSICPKLGRIDGINGVRSRFSRYHFNEPLTANALIMLEMYHRKFDAKKQIFAKDPVHDKNSHCADAIRMDYNATECVNEFERGNPMPLTINWGD